jgi:hypothetical protein
MKLRPKGAPQNPGRFILLYSETAAGKTTSCFQSLPKPILVLCAEQRNAETSAEAANVPEFDEHGNINWIIAEYTDFLSLMDFIVDIDKKITKEDYGIEFKDIKSVVLDGVTQLMQNLSAEIQDVAAEARDKADKALILDVKLTKEGYGALGNHMLRLMTPLVALSQRGKIVVMNALAEAEEQAWNSTQRLVPSLMGNLFSSKLPGMCDLIGFVERRYEDIEVEDPVTGITTIKHKLSFPPTVKFENGYDSKGNKEQFMCKWAGRRPTVKGEEVELIQCPLDFVKILKLNKGTSGEPTGTNRIKK